MVVEVRYAEWSRTVSYGMSFIWATARIDGDHRALGRHLDTSNWGLENPTIRVVEQLAAALDAAIVESSAIPATGEPPPTPLRRGRRPKRKNTSP
jgi:hypothetical protein